MFNIVPIRRACSHKGKPYVVPGFARAPALGRYALDVRSRDRDDRAIGHCVLSEGSIEIALDNPAFWIAVLQIIAIDIVLGGDNAVVIALASRRLPVQQRKLAIFWGVLGAIVLRVVLIFFALYLLAIPYLKVAGAALLLWIGVKLLLPEPEGEGHHIDASKSLMGAVKTIIVADAVMSLDNVIAIAGAAKGSIGLVIFGLVVSVPIIVWGSKLVLKLMDRFPIVITLGAGLLGWIAGDMVATDVATQAWFDSILPSLDIVAAAVGAAVVVVVGKWLARRRLLARRRVTTDLAPPPATAPSHAPGAARSSE